MEIANKSILENLENDQQKVLNLQLQHKLNAQQSQVIQQPQKFETSDVLVQPKVYLLHFNYF